MLSLRPHEGVQLPSVRISMAGGTSKVLPVIGRRRLRLEISGQSMAVAAGNCHMASGKRKARLTVPGQAEGRRHQSLQGVAILAAIEVRGAPKLPGMRVAMTIGTALELQLEQGVGALGNVALGTGHRGMLALERIRGRRVFPQPESGRLEAFDGVTRCALAPIDALGELSTMRIRPVTIHAFLKGQRLVEVSSQVALHAVHGSVPTEKAELGSRVVKVLPQLCRGHLLPSRRAVARLAGRFESSAMRIRVAIRAAAKGESGVARLFVLPRKMALLASDFAMQTGEGIAGFGVVEPPDADGFPIVVVVTLQTVGTKLPLVLVLMAGGATRGNSQKCLAEIFDLDGGALVLANMFRTVTLRTGQAGMLAFESVSGFPVIEGLDVPLNQAEAFAVMLGVASRALQACARSDVERSVQPFSGTDARSNFRVALQALECRFPGGNLVAGSAVGHATEGSMGARQRARRNLGGERKRHPQNTHHDPPQKIPSCVGDGFRRHADVENCDGGIAATADG